MNAIEAICKQYAIEGYTINNDGSVDVKGNVWFDSKGFEKLPLKFGKVSGLFHCGDNKLTTLVGCPIEVGAEFYCNNNELSSLYGAPKYVGRDFDCDVNAITTLEYCPQLNGAFDFRDNSLPDIVKSRLINTNNRELINIFLKYQNHFEVWSGGFNEENFNELMTEIKDGLL